MRSFDCECLKLILLFFCLAKLVETGTFGGEEDDDVLFDEMVDEYEDEDDAIDAVSAALMKQTLLMVTFNEAYSGTTDKDIPGDTVVVKVPVPMKQTPTLRSGLIYLP